MAGTQSETTTAGTRMNTRIKVDGKAEVIGMSQRLLRNLGGERRKGEGILTLTIATAWLLCALGTHGASSSGSLEGARAELPY